MDLRKTSKRLISNMAILVTEAVRSMPIKTLFDTLTWLPVNLLDRKLALRNVVKQYRTQSMGTY